MNQQQRVYKERKVSDITFTNSRCTTHLRLQYAKRAGSIYSVILFVDNVPVFRAEPNDIGRFGEWLANNAETLQELDDANKDPAVGPKLGEDAQ
jgi:hypothetical protein